MSEWQPIESAPRDGTRVDLWMVNNDGVARRVADAYWEENGYTQTWIDGNWRDVRSPCWYAPGFDYDGADGSCETRRVFCDHPRQMKVIFDEPTHWLALPEPPKEVE